MSGSGSTSTEVGNIRVFKDPTGAPVLQRGSEPQRYDVVGPNDPRIIEERISRGKRFIYNDTPEKISHWVDAFLREIRSDFPNLYLTNIVRGEARMRKFSWGNDIKKYNAKTAGILQVNKMIVDNMIAVGRRALTYSKTTDSGYVNCMTHWDRFIFQLGIAIAHEIVHFFTGFLTGTSYPDTPPKITYSGFGNSATGEAGRFWEGQLFRGIVDVFEDPRDPLGPFQAGALMIVYRDVRRGETCFSHIGRDYIRQFLTLNFNNTSFPAQVEPNAPSLDLQEQQARYPRNMADFRLTLLPRKTPTLPGSDQDRMRGPPPDTPLYLDRFPTYRHRLAGPAAQYC